MMTEARHQQIFKVQHPEDETYPGLLLLRLEGRIFFVNAERVAEKIRLLIEGSRPTVVALHLRGVSDLEYTGLKMLTAGEKRGRERGAPRDIVLMNTSLALVAAGKANDWISGVALASRSIDSGAARDKLAALRRAMA